MFSQDIAPCHCGDDCKDTCGTYLQRKRRSRYAASGVASYLYSSNSTPELCVNDSVHTFFQVSWHSAINEVVGRVGLLHNYPMAPEDLTHGGPYYTESGIRRGRGPWHYVLACLVVWKTFPQIGLIAALFSFR